MNLLKVLLGLMGVLAVGGVLWINRPARRSAPPEVVAALQSAKEQIRQAPLIPISDKPAMMGALDAEVSIDDATIRPFQRDSLIHTIADILQLLSNADAEAHASWMRDRGYSLREPGDLPDPVTRSYINITSEQPSDSFDVFQTLYESSLAYKGGRSRPVGVFVGEQAVHVDITSLDAPGPIWQAFSDPGDVEWMLGDIQSGYGFWRPDTSLDDIVLRDGGTLATRVFLGLSTGAGGDAPLRLGMSFYYDRESSLWRLGDIVYFLYSYGGDSGQSFTPGPYY